MVKKSIPGERNVYMHWRASKKKQSDFYKTFSPKKKEKKKKKEFFTGQLIKGKARVKKNLSKN